MACGKEDSSWGDVSALAEEQLRGLGGVVLEFGKSLVADDLEGLQFLMRRLDRAAVQRPSMASVLSEWVCALQSAVAEYWGACKLLVRALL